MNNLLGRIRIEKRDEKNFKIINIWRNLKLFQLEVVISGLVWIILFSSRIICTRTVRGFRGNSRNWRNNSRRGPNDKCWNWDNYFDHYYCRNCSSNSKKIRVRIIQIQRCLKKKFHGIVTLNYFLPNYGLSL